MLNARANTRLMEVLQPGSREQGVPAKELNSSGTGTGDGYVFSMEDAELSLAGLRAVPTRDLEQPR